MATAQNLIRKQYLVSKEQARKVEKIAKSNGSSAAEIVRMAIEAYDPETPDLNGEENEILSLALNQVQDAIKVTQTACRRLRKTRRELKKDH